MKNFKAIVFLVFFLLYGIGIFIGSARQVMIENQSSMYEYLESAVLGYDVSVTESIKSIFKDNIKVLVCLFLGGFFVIGPVVLGGVMVAKGYATGFAITAILRLFGVRGLLFCVANFVSSMIMVPVLCWYSCKAIENIKEIRYDRKEFLRRLFLLLIAVFIVLIIDSGVRGYLSAVLIKFVSVG